MYFFYTQKWEIMACLFCEMQVIIAYQFSLKKYFLCISNYSSWQIPEKHLQRCGGLKFSTDPSLFISHMKVWLKKGHEMKKGTFYLSIQMKACKKVREQWKVNHRTTKGMKKMKVCWLKFF